MFEFNTPLTLILILLGLTFYTIIPDLFLHRLGLGSFKRQYGPGVALTFDDGPDPQFTPRILDILDHYKVTATFFLVGEKVKQYPDLARLIHDRGHKIGAHGEHHRISWKMSPWTTWREWQENIKILEDLTGKPIDWIRPPWGTFNLALYWWMIKNKKKAILWNAKGQDWQANRTPSEIASLVLKNIRHGSIILLHDSGGETGAPEKSIEALDLICQKLIKTYKLPILPLELPKWSLWRRLAFVTWEKWEYFYAKLFNVQPINATNLFRLSKKRYKGPNLYQQNGDLLAKKGDIVAEIHLDSLRFQIQDTDPHKIAFKALSQVRNSLPDLARYLAESPDYQNIKIILGLTLLNRGVKGLGFSVQELPPTWVNQKIGMLQKIIISVYHPLGRARDKKRLGNTPKLVWITQEKLLEHWLPRNKEASMAGETNILFLPFLQMQTGHHKVADALINSLAPRIPHASLQKVDILSYAYGNAEKLVSNLYRQWINYWPQNYKYIYERLVYPGTSSSYLSWFETLLQSQVLRLINQEQTNLVICTQAYPSYVLSRLKEQKKISIPVINVYTDFFINKVWGKKGIDYHFVPNHTTKSELITRYEIPEDRIIITGIPIDESFIYQSKPLRKKSSYTILVAGGNGGFGEINTLLQKIIDSPKLNFLVLCGKNKRLYDMLASLKLKNIQPFPYLSSTAEINRLYDQADAIITKPGGITISEAFQKRLPIFIHSTLPGQEEVNLQNLISQGLVYTLDLNQPLEEQLLSILENESQLILFREKVQQFYQSLEAKAWEKILEILDSREQVNPIHCIIQDRKDHSIECTKNISTLEETKIR